MLKSNNKKNEQKKCGQFGCDRSRACFKRTNIFFLNFVIKNNQKYFQCIHFVASLLSFYSSLIRFCVAFLVLVQFYFRGKLWFDFLFTLTVRLIFRARDNQKSVIATKLFPFETLHIKSSRFSTSSHEIRYKMRYSENVARRFRSFTAH